MTLIITSYEEFREKVLFPKKEILLKTENLNQFYKHKIRFINMKYVETRCENGVKEPSSDTISLNFTDVFATGNFITMNMDIGDFYSMALDGTRRLENGAVYEIWCTWQYDVGTKQHALKILYIART